MSLCCISSCCTILTRNVQLFQPHRISLRSRMLGLLLLSLEQPREARAIAVSSPLTRQTRDQQQHINIKSLLYTINPSFTIEEIHHIHDRNTFTSAIGVPHITIECRLKTPLAYLSPPATSNSHSNFLNCLPNFLPSSNLLIHLRMSKYFDGAFRLVQTAPLTASEVSICAPPTPLLQQPSCVLLRKPTTFARKTLQIRSWFYSHLPLLRGQ